jgi:hypothetical protein
MAYRNDTLQSIPAQPNFCRSLEPETASQEAAKDGSTAGMI